MEHIFDNLCRLEESKKYKISQVPKLFIGEHFPSLPTYSSTRKGVIIIGEKIIYLGTFNTSELDYMTSPRIKCEKKY